MLSKLYFKKSKKKSSLNKVPYALSSKPQRYGPGTNLSVINLNKSVNSSSVGRFSLQSLLQENQEFTRKKELFRYFKIIEIRASFLPSNIQGSFNNIAVLMSWWLVQNDSSEIYQDDATKLIPVYRTKTRTLRFLPPKTVLDVQTIAQTPVNKFFDFTQFLSTDFTTNFPGWLYVYNTSNSVLYFNFEAIVLFRGNDNQSAPSKTVQEEDPFADKILSFEENDKLVHQNKKDNTIVENSVESYQEEEPLTKEQQIVKLKQELLKLQLEIKKPPDIQEEEKEEPKEPFKNDDRSRKNKPK